MCRRVQSLLNPCPVCSLRLELNLTSSQLIVDSGATRLSRPRTAQARQPRMIQGESSVGRT